ncbi:MAG TPA: RcnB family protein [Rhizomicrobium sp.]|nr:RcnB family protein [Rhizomicrobium sp.]
MKRILASAVVLALAAAPLAAGSAAAETIVKKKGPHEVVVKHKPGAPHRVVIRRPAARPGMFWHRGVWKARIHAPVFVYPRGWHFRRWAIGTRLPALFLTDAYFYNDYAPLGLQAPPPGYRWVRYGSDLLLVNLRTGEVEDTAEDVFD